jgi:hypothetical protein
MGPLYYGICIFEKQKGSGHFEKVKVEPAHYSRSKTAVPAFSEKVVMH